MSTLDFYHPASQLFINKFLLLAYMKDIFGIHDPEEVWHAMDNPKPSYEQLEHYLRFMEGDSLIDPMPNSGFGDFDYFKLTEQARKRVGLTDIENEPIKKGSVGYKQNHDND